MFGERFEYCISNPPYQLDITGTSAEQIYPFFIDAGKEIALESIMITPARFLFNAGKTNKQWNSDKLNDPCFSVKYYTPDSEKLFPGVQITGGVAVTQYSQTVGTSIKVFTPFSEVSSILSKVREQSTIFMSELIHPQSKFILERLYEEHPELKDAVGSDGRERRLTSNIFQLLDEVFLDGEAEPSSEVSILGLDQNGKRVHRRVKKIYIEEDDVLNNYTVFIPGSNGSPVLGQEASNVVGTPVVGGVGVGCTQTFISVGSFKTLAEAQAVEKYLRSRFARFLVATLKITQANKKNVWGNVPIQEWSSTSDVDWSKPVDEVDELLFEKYGLSVSEREFICSAVRPLM